VSFKLAAGSGSESLSLFEGRGPGVQSVEFNMLDALRSNELILGDSSNLDELVVLGHTSSKMVVRREEGRRAKLFVCHHMGTGHFRMPSLFSSYHHHLTSLPSSVTLPLPTHFIGKFIVIASSISTIE
jgi:hypothetical protein